MYNVCNSWKNVNTNNKMLLLWVNNLKSLSLIYFVKIRPPDFLCNEFLINIYRLLQNYTLEICTLSKIMMLLEIQYFFW